ncbi:hypothetical protein FB451DRAFT_1390981 [Mycena latifolia]|nr:hypothetical protein FB451DRAFT_1390981 [Mycena latifolia]
MCLVRAELARRVHHGRFKTTEDARDAAHGHGYAYLRNARGGLPRSPLCALLCTQQVRPAFVNRSSSGAGSRPHGTSKKRTSRRSRAGIARRVRLCTPCLSPQGKSPGEARAGVLERTKPALRLALRLGHAERPPRGAKGPTRGVTTTCTP